MLLERLPQPFSNTFIASELPWLERHWYNASRQSLIWLGRFFILIWSFGCVYSMIVADFCEGVKTQDSSGILEFIRNDKWTKRGPNRQFHRLCYLRLWFAADIKVLVLSQFSISLVRVWYRRFWHLGRLMRTWCAK